MGIGKWKKIGKDTWINDDLEKSLTIKQHSDKLYYVKVYSVYGSNYGGYIVVSKKKTKSAALKFAKRWMRTFNWENPRKYLKMHN